MLVNLKDDSNSLNNKSLFKASPGKRFDKHVIKDMVRAYRVANKNALKYTHFNAYEILDLFMANKVITDATLIAAIKAQENEIRAFGMKIYLGVHISEDTVPIKQDPKETEKYFGKTTTILCNTNIVKDTKYEFLYADILNDVALSQFDDPAGEGLDQAEMAPPYHEEEDEDNDHDIGYPL